MASTTAFPRARRAWSFRVPPRAARLAAAAVRPHRAALGNLASMPLTVAAYGLLAAAATEWNALAGMACTAVLLIVLEHQIADDE